jgi:phage shock protein C
VCGGIAEYFSVDPTIIRIVTVVLTVMTGVVPLLICYALAWIIIPNEPPAH